MVQIEDFQQAPSNWEEEMTYSLRVHNLATYINDMIIGVHVVQLVQTSWVQHVTLSQT